MCNMLVSGGFGKPPYSELDIKRATIGKEIPAGLPENFEEKLLYWKKKGQVTEWPGYDVKLARISFGYEGQNFELLPASIGVDGARFERIYTASLDDLKELGCEYGVYTGYMD